MNCTPAEVAALQENRCPDCGHVGFLAGPCGGMNQNIQCANPECGSRFNIGPQPPAAEPLPEWLASIERTLSGARKVLEGHDKDTSGLTPMERLLELAKAQHAALDLTDHTSHADLRWRIYQRARRLWEGNPR